MSTKQTYTFYFEVFGQKKKWSTEAISLAEAHKALNSFVVSKINLVKTEGETPSDAAARAKKKPSSFEDIFGDLMKNNPFKL